MLRCLRLGFAFFLVGCASGSEVESSFTPTPTGGDGGRGHGSGASQSNGSTSNGSSSSSTSASGSGAGGGAGAGGGSGAGGGGTTCDFTALNTCATAQSLGDVSGDEGGVVNTNGIGSKWLKVRIAETDSGVLETDLAYEVRLTSPPGMNYDLYVRQGAQDGPQNCSATEVKGSGTPESVSDSWDDDQGIGGEDDSVWLSVEVRYVSGNDCSTQWSLNVIGG
jgi:hypothetical protein